jgi:ParB family chromosome partitioning protein
MAVRKNKGLGKGLEALFNDVEISTRDSDKPSGAQEGIFFVDINEIKPNNEQPRKSFQEDKIEELAESIAAHGIIQPILVRPSNKGYEIIAGERRWRAARKASLREVPCIIRELDEEQNFLVSIIENMQRENLNPVEEAEALNQMISRFDMTQEEVSKSIGKSRPYISNALRLLKLPAEIQEMVVRGELTGGHARTLAGIKDEKRQIYIANRVVNENLSVRATEEIANTENEKSSSENPQRPKPRAKNREITSMEENLRRALGTKVEINQGVKRGKIEIEYYSRDELERLLELLLGLRQ